MEKIFAEMFSRKPDLELNGDYYYNTPWLDDVFIQEAKRRELSFEEFFEWKDSMATTNFINLWGMRTFQNEFSDLFDDKLWLENFSGTNKNGELEKIINTITNERKPFMDIASGSGMGLASYIVKLNPEIPCLVTDIDMRQMQCLRSSIDNHIPEYNISLAAFDNFDMPLKDDSLEYITSIAGLSSSAGNPLNKTENFFQIFEDRLKLSSEVYRVLKPGGLFITIESSQEYDYDLQKLYSNYSANGKLYGVYTYDEIQAVCGLLTEDSWHDKFASVGFEIEFEKSYYERNTLNSIMQFIHYITKCYGIHKWEKKNWDEELRSGNISWNYCNHSEFEGFDLYNINTFFILRKPGSI